MPYINYSAKELCFKIVYFGPGMGGKTTNLIRIHKNLSAKAKSDIITLDTAEERTLFFDFLPLDVGTVGGFSLRFNLYTVPGQVQYEASRRLILDGADGVVYVADSQPHLVEENISCYQGMIKNIQSYGIDPVKFPKVLQYNKRDCENPIEIGSLEKVLNIEPSTPVFSATANIGEGVMETIHAVCRLVIQNFKIEY